MTGLTWLELSPRDDDVEERAAVRPGFISSHGLPWLGEGCIVCERIHSAEGQFLCKRAGICRE